MFSLIHNYVSIYIIDVDLKTLSVERNCFKVIQLCFLLTLMYSDSDYLNQLTYLK